MRQFAYVFLLLAFMSCKNTWHIAEIDPDTYRFDRYLPVREDSSILEIIAPYKLQLDEDMNQVIGELTTPLLKELPESTLGNFVADLIVSQAEKCSGQVIDFGVQNQGGLRINEISKGPFTVSKAFDIMPFDNVITILESDGSIVRQLFERIASKGGWPVSESIQLTIKNEQLASLTINDEQIEDDRIYRFALPDYIADGGDKCYFLTDQKRLPCDIYVRDAIIYHIQDLTARGDSISAELTGRIIIK